jgi:hypothetical protein
MVVYYNGTLRVGDMPQDLDGNPLLKGEALRTALIDTVKYLADLRIRETGVGWMVERQITGGTPVPEEVKTLCQSIRDWSNEREGLLLAAIDDEALLAIDLSRP